MAAALGVGVEGSGAAWAGVGVRGRATVRAASKVARKGFMAGSMACPRREDKRAGWIFRAIRANPCFFGIRSFCGLMIFKFPFWICAEARVWRPDLP